LAPRIVLIAVAVAWVTLLFCAFHPGLLSTDPLVQLSQGLSGTYTLVHPPILSFLLAASYRVSGSVWPVLLLELLVFATCFALLAAQARRRWLGVAAFALFLALPPVWAVTVCIWKDVAFAGAMLIACTLLFFERRRTAIAMLILAAAFRHNGIVAVVPLLWFALEGFPLARRAPAFLAAVAFAALLPRTQMPVFGAVDDWTLRWVLADDLGAMYAARPELYRDSVFAPELSAEDVHAIYSSESADTLFFSSPKHVDLNGLTARRQELTAEWLRVVSQAPLTYLGERAARFARILGWGGPAAYVFHRGIDPNGFGLQVTDHTLVFRGLSRIRDGAISTPLCRGVVWIALCAVTAGLALRSRQRLAFWISASGLSYAGLYFFVAPATDFRYLFWTLIAGLVAVLCLMAARA
jgi:hypothetical protein